MALEHQVWPNKYRVITAGLFHSLILLPPPPPPLQILALENRVLELELRSEKVSRERDALRDQLHALETSRKELADEYIILKSNYLALGKELDQEVRWRLLWFSPLHNTVI